jgi:hypothetical protein
MSAKIFHDCLTRRSDRVERNWSKALSPAVRDEPKHYLQQPQTRRRLRGTMTQEERKRRLLQSLPGSSIGTSRDRES